MIIYIDNDFKCHAEDAQGLSAVESSFFDGKCKRLIEGYRYVPAGQSWMRPDGVVFQGEMIAPHEDYAILAAAQSQYEEMLAETLDLKAALAKLGVTDNE